MEELDQKFIDFYQNVGRSMGINDNLLLKIIAILFLEHKEIAMEDLAKKTGYSLASISSKAKILETMGFARRTSKPGTRKAFLFIEKDFLKLFQQQLIKKQEYLIKQAKEKIPEIIKEYKHKSKTNKQKQKLKILENYHAQILKFEKIIQYMIKKIEEM